MEETFTLDRSGHVGFDLHLVGFVGYGCETLLTVMLVIPVLVSLFR